MTGESRLQNAVLKRLKALAKELPPSDLPPGPALLMGRPDRVSLIQSLPIQIFVTSDHIVGLRLIFAYLISIRVLPSQ